MPLSIEISQRQGAGGALAQVVRLSGSLDNDTVDQAENAMVPILKKPFPTVVFNLAELTFVTSSGISFFLNTKKQLEAKAIVVGVVGMRPSIRKVFDIVKALPASRVFESVQEMDNYLAAIQRKVEEE
jgi:anti-anti-sigma factor